MHGGSDFYQEEYIIVYFTNITIKSQHFNCKLIFQDLTSYPHDPISIQTQEKDSFDGNIFSYCINWDGAAPNGFRRDL